MPAQLKSPEIDRAHACTRRKADAARLSVKVPAMRNSINSPSPSSGSRQPGQLAKKEMHILMNLFGHHARGHLLTNQIQRR